MVPGHWERHLHVSAVVSSGRVQILRSSIMQEVMTWTKATHAICMHCTRDLFRLCREKDNASGVVHADSAEIAGALPLVGVESTCALQTRLTAVRRVAADVTAPALCMQAGIGAMPAWRKRLHAVAIVSGSAEAPTGMCASCSASAAVCVSLPLCPSADGLTVASLQTAVGLHGTNKALVCLWHCVQSPCMLQGYQQPSCAKMYQAGGRL